MSRSPDAPLFLHETLVREDRMINLDADEAAHATRSRRLDEGDRILVTNGAGLLGEGTVSAIGRKPLSVMVSLISVVETPVTKPAITLATALPKGERLHTLLDMATQLGVSAFQPLECARSVVRYQPKMRDRWYRVIVSAAKQCRQTRLPALLEPVTPERLVAKRQGDSLLVYGDAGSESLCHGARGIMRPPGNLVLIVGPEGGFDNDELTMLDQCAGALGVSCGPLVLRTETAGVALLSIANQWLTSLENQNT